MQPAFSVAAARHARDFRDGDVARPPAHCTRCCACRPRAKKEAPVRDASVTASL